MTITLVLLLVSYVALGYLFIQGFWRLVHDLNGLVTLWHNPQYDPVVTASIVFWMYLPFVVLAFQGNDRTITSCVFYIFIGLAGYLIFHPVLMILRGYIIDPNYSNFFKTYVTYQQPLLSFILGCVWYNAVIEPISKFVIERM